MTVTSAVEPVTAVNVGDFFVSSWGYDQTNVDFYRVVEVSKSGKTVKVQEWCQQTMTTLRGHASSEAVVPGDGPRKGGWVRSGNGDERVYDPEAAWPVTTHRLRFSGKPRFTVSSYADASLWDGSAQHQTASGWGH